MGRFATVPLTSLRPTQDYLFSDTVDRYAREIDRGIEAVLSVREPLEEDAYEIIDGHHAAAALLKTGRTDANVWIAQSPNDVPAHDDLEGSIQYGKYENVCEEIGRRHMASFGYIPMIGGVEVSSIDELMRSTNP